MRWVGEAAFPKEQKSEPRFALPNPGFCTKKNEAPEHLALKTSRAYIWEIQKAVEYRDPPLEELSHKLTDSESQGRGSSLKNS